jgi:hypothetical protein
VGSRKRDEEFVWRVLELEYLYYPCNIGMGGLYYVLRIFTWSSA